MPKTKSVFLVFLSLVVVLAGVYAYSLMSRSLRIGEVLSPVIDALSGCALLFAYLRSNRKQKENLALLFFAFGCFFWMLSDIAWGVYLNLGKAPAHNIPVLLGYMSANIVIGFGTVFIGIGSYSKWERIKSVVEALAIGIMSVLFIWIVLFHRGEQAIELLTSYGVLSAAGIFFDMFIIAEFLILFISGLKRNLPVYVNLVRTGILLFYAAVLFYLYCTYQNIYYSGSITDVLLVVSLVLIAFGALWKTLANGSFQNQSASDDVGRSLWLYLLAFPVLTVVLEGFYFIDLFMFAGIIALYHAAVKFIHLAKENGRLLENETLINGTLEKRIYEQLQELTVLANQDTVTNLYNRRYFSVILDETIRTLKDGKTLAVVQFDVDRFKTINDSYGHDVGDRVIIELSNRLISWNKYDAVLARLGGDEFVILMHGKLTRNKLTEICKQIIDVCGAPIYVDHQVLYLTISIGVSICPKDACDSVSVMKNADIAMYKAKAEGYNKFVFFSPSFKENISRKNEIEALLRNADLQTEFELVYQPQFTLPDKKLIGAEALIRWKSAEHGYIPPSVFVPIAEEINYINRIGKWVLFKAVEQIIKWNTEYALHLKMGINISPKQLTEDDFFMTLKTLITTNQFNASWIDAEITENLMIEEKATVKPIFDLFKELEISVSIDDFGSGYSSLGYLNKYHFDRIKIDKSLIDNLKIPGGSGVEVVKAIITMSNAVGKVTIAEGVETTEQLQILSELGCRQVQGYLLGKPVSAEEFERKFIEKDVSAVI